VRVLSSVCAAVCVWFSLVVWVSVEVSECESKKWGSEWVRECVVHSSRGTVVSLFEGYNDWVRNVRKVAGCILDCIGSEWVSECSSDCLLQLIRHCANLICYDHTTHSLNYSTRENLLPYMTILYWLITYSLVVLFCVSYYIIIEWEKIIESLFLDAMRTELWTTEWRPSRPPVADSLLSSSRRPERELCAETAELPFPE
jgi:hypothetical protein